MKHRFQVDQAALLIVDVQERLCAAMTAERLVRVVNRTLAAIEGAQALGFPVVVTEQYPKGLGPTIREVREKLGTLAPVEKVRFSALVPEVKEQLGARTQVMVCGMETHVCVFQTVRELCELGRTPFVVTDGVISRNAADHEVGLRLCQEAGACLTTVETVLFDALGQAGGPAFKAISAAVK